MPTFEIKALVDGKTWYRLASIADARGVRVADLVMEAAGVVIEDGHADELVTELRRAYRAGFRADPRPGLSHEEQVELWRRWHTFGGEVWAELDRPERKEKAA